MRQPTLLAALAARPLTPPSSRPAAEGAPAPSPPVGRRRLAAALALLGALSLAAPAAAGEPLPDDPWRILVGARESLVASGAVVADFVQTYTPAGFTAGERESGRVSLALPSCLRWDYELPLPKSYLLCGRAVYSWNPDESTGRRAVVDRDREPGLDLLFLSVEDLRKRYRAAARRLPNGSTEIALTPLAAKADAPAVQATVVVDASGTRLDGLGHQDPDGSLTRFTLTGWRTLTDERVFAPPRLEWIEE